MKRSAQGRRMALRLLAAAAVSALIAAGPLVAGDSPPAAPKASAAWAELLRRRPFPYRLPLPESSPTLLDGTYVKSLPQESEHVHCLRCPDYAPESGNWKLNFDRGVFRIQHRETGWKSIGSFFVAGDRLLLANDPNCIDAFGVYAFRLELDRLELNSIDDPCAIRLRAANLTQRPWRACRPPNTEAAVTGHWPVPEGCE